MRKRSLTDTDRAEWASYARLVAPLAGARPEVAPEPVTSVVPAPAAAITTLPAAPPRPVPTPTPRPAPAPLVVGDSPGGVDKATWARFRQGRLAATRTLDLHGRTAQRAHADLERFLHAAAAEGVRCVEVITGRGQGETGGVIRREFPLWINAPGLRALVLAAAHPHALNPGSVRLLLKRRRPAGAAT